MMRLLLFFWAAVWGVAQAQTLPGDYPQASQRLLTQTDVCERDAQTLKIMRNEIFARYGHIFKSPDLQQHFQAQAWYTPTSADVTAQLTETEKANIALIRRQEDHLKIGEDFDLFYAAFEQAAQRNDLASLWKLVWVGEFFESEAQFRESWARHAAEIREALRDGRPHLVYEGEQRLAFGPWHSGVQYKQVIFQKRGRCWYFHSVMMAG